jgi:hypothetical protein
MSRNEQLGRLAQVLNELKSQGTLQQGDVEEMLDAFKVLNSTGSGSRRRRAMVRVNRVLSRLVRFSKQK